MHKLLLYISALLLPSLLCGQEPSASAEQGPQAHPPRSGIAFQPNKTPIIRGVALGIFGQDAVCNAPYVLKTNGLNLQVGCGLLFSSFPLQYTYLSEPPSPIPPPKSVTNGLQCSIFGTQTALVNGVSLSGWVSLGDRLNGLSVQLLGNYYRQVRGASFGLINDAQDLSGLQVGLRNSAQQAKGVQFGLFNKAREPRGLLQLGLWNNIDGQRFGRPLVQYRKSTTAASTDQ